MKYVIHTGLKYKEEDVAYSVSAVDRIKNIEPIKNLRDIVDSKK